MKKYNILVTGVGAIIGYGIIKSLRSSIYDCRIIGMDIYPDAVGQAWCDVFIQAIPARDPQYSSFVMNLIDEYKIDLVMFGTEQEINRLVADRELLGDYYQKLALNNPAIISMADDKWETYTFLSKNGFPAIPSLLSRDFDEDARKLRLPFLLKPRHSYAGKGMHKINNERDFQYFSGLTDDEQFMIQKIIGDIDHEYTVASFGFGDGTGIEEPIILKRKLSQEGATAKAIRVQIPELCEQVKKLNAALKPVGPINYQFRKDGEEYYLLESNPRISSSTSIRMLLGYNEAEMCIAWFVNHEKPQSSPIKDGTVVRYIADQVLI